MTQLTYDDIRAGDELYDERTDTYHRVVSIDDCDLVWEAVVESADGVRDRQPDTRETISRAGIEAALPDDLHLPDDDPIPLTEETLKMLDGTARHRDVTTLAESIRESSAARGVDSWAVEHIGLSAAEWARLTDRNRSTVARNVRRANRD